MVCVWGIEPHGCYPYIKRSTIFIFLTAFCYNAHATSRNHPQNANYNKFKAHYQILYFYVKFNFKPIAELFGEWKRCGWEEKIYWTNKGHTRNKSTTSLLWTWMAEMERFELSRRDNRPTPLAGAPLQPLEYFSGFWKQIRNMKLPRQWETQ